MRKSFQLYKLVKLKIFKKNLRQDWELMQNQKLKQTQKNIIDSDYKSKIIIQILTIKQTIVLKLLLMPQQQDFKELYQQKCIQLQQLQQQFNELQQQSTLIMNDLEDQIKEKNRKIEAQDREIKELKEKKKYMTSTIERQLDQAQKEKNQFKNKFKEFEKKVIELQIINEDLQNQLRATKSTLEQYQASTQRTMEELAILRVQLEQSTASNQEQIARLKQQLKQTEQEVTIMHHKGKRNEADENARSFNNPDHQRSIGIGSEIVNNQTPSSLKQSHAGSVLDNNINPFQYNKQANSSLFKQTLKDIRAYLSSIDSRKQEMRRKVINLHRDFVTTLNS